MKGNHDNIMDLIILSAIKEFFLKLIDLHADRPNLILDKNIEGYFKIVEYDGFYLIIELPLRISNIGKQTTTINYIQLFLIDNKKRKLTYGYKTKDIDYKINPGESYKNNFKKGIFVRSNKNIKYKEILKNKMKVNPIRFIFSSIYEDNLTSEKLLSKILIKTPHQKWVFNLPLQQVSTNNKDKLIKDLNSAEKMDKNFNAMYWDEIK